MQVIQGRLLRYLLLLAVAFNVRPAQAQLVLTPQVPVAGVTQQQQLWNLVALNSSTAPYDAEIELSLVNMATGQQVLSGTSRRLQLNKGPQVLQWPQVQPVAYQTAGGTPVSAAPTGFLPVGYYRVCYHVFRYQSDRREPVAEECTELEVAPLSPPQLAMPADGSEVEQEYPQFSWIPPAPAGMFQRLTYELRLVELLPNQGHADAIQRNLPLLVRDQLTQPSYAYPASGKPLKKGKTYAWQVIAKDLNNYTVATDVWRFTTPQLLPVETSVQPYVRLSQTALQSRFLSTGVLRFAYSNESNDSVATYEILTSQQATKRPLLQGSIPLQPGENFIDLDLKKERRLAKGEYLLQLLNSKGEKWLMNFSYTD